MSQERRTDAIFPGLPSEETIRSLVHAFYARMRHDDLLGPIFETAVGDDWDTHLAKMCDFWSSVMRTSGRYHGNPMLAHMRQKAIRPEHFALWLEHFRATAREVCDGDEAEAFIQRAENIAKSLELALFYKPRPAATAAD